MRILQKLHKCNYTGALREEKGGSCRKGLCGSDQDCNEISTLELFITKRLLS